MSLRVGILGAGQMGRTHALALARSGKARVVGVADTDPERAGALAAEVGASVATDLEALLATRLDLLVVATPNREHATASLAALERGVGVLCEKPMAIDLAQARAVRAAAERAGSFYVVGHNRRHAPVYRRVRALVDKGFRPLLATFKMHEGDFRTPAWVTDRAISGGFLYENLVHFFDLMEWLVGPIAEVSCLARGPLYPDLNDFVVSVAFEAGAIGSLTATGHASWLHPAERTELVGDHATIVVEGLDRVVHSPGDGVPIAIHDHSREPREERWGYLEQDAEIVEARLAGRAPCFSAARALRTLEIAEACLESARAGHPVKPAAPPRD